MTRATHTHNLTRGEHRDDHGYPSCQIHQSSAEIRVNWNTWIRTIHRGVSIVFTVTVTANFVAMAQGVPPAWVTYSPLPPLAVLLFTGLYLFARPYIAKWRNVRTPTA